MCQGLLRCEFLLTKGTRTIRALILRMLLLCVRPIQLLTSKELVAYVALDGPWSISRRVFILFVKVQLVVGGDLLRAVLLGTAHSPWSNRHVHLHLIFRVGGHKMGLQSSLGSEAEGTNSTWDVLDVRANVLVPIKLAVKRRVTDGTVEVAAARQGTRRVYLLYCFWFLFRFWFLFFRLLVTYHIFRGTHCLLVLIQFGLCVEEVIAIGTVESTFSALYFSNWRWFLNYYFFGRRW